MRLSNVARYFDQEAIFDGYTGQRLFAGQLSSFNDATATGTTLRRRALSFAPTLALPARRCLKIGPMRWIASIGILDSFQGVEMRNTHNLRLATNSFQILTPGQVLSPAPLPLSAYGYAEYFRDTVNTQTYSETDTSWNVFFASKEPVAQGLFLKDGSRLLRVRQAYINPEDLKLAQSDELAADWLQSVTLSGNGAYDPVTDTTSTETVTMPAILVDIKTFYRWRLWVEAQMQPGDKMLFISNIINIAVGSNVLLQNSNWRVVSFQAEQDVWALHVRRIWYQALQNF